jgi:hypothetical protein
MSVSSMCVSWSITLTAFRVALPDLKGDWVDGGTGLDGALGHCRRGIADLVCQNFHCLQ